MNYTETEVIENYNKFIAFIKLNFSGARLTKLLELYGDKGYGYIVSTSPASAKDYTNNAFIGGYLNHVMTLCKASYGVKKVWESMGTVVDFTDEEMLFAAINCGLGNLGDKDVGEYYLTQENGWRVQNCGEVYKINTDLQYMTIADRSLFILQQYEIACTWKEYLAIKLSAGLYNDGNKSYLQNFNKDMEIKTALPQLIHMAYMTAYRNEIDIEKQKNL